MSSKLDKFREVVQRVHDEMDCELDPYEEVSISSVESWRDALQQALFDLEEDE